MPILSPPIQEELQQLFEEKLTGQVRISLFTQRESLIVVPGRDCSTCKETGELLEEVTSLSDKLELNVHDFYGDLEAAAERGIERIPAILLEGEARGRVRYFGIPAGSEFPALIEGLIDVSKGTTDLTEESKQSLSTISKDVHVQVFVTPT